ncbi:hypothetical protein HanOQP8_Chr05g0182531 [Helianthus annuus]|nr:hypothetical protein HanOQP8_Chr05g0182531 [Helianthus annuus]
MFQLFCILHILKSHEAKPVSLSIVFPCDVRPHNLSKIPKKLRHLPHCLDLIL